jgi:hypothetical protein
MSPLKYNVALGSAVLLSVLLLLNAWLTVQNAARGNVIQQQQQAINSGQQAEQILRSLGTRIAQAADKDPQLRELMVRNELKATIEVDGQRKTIP